MTPPNRKVPRGLLNIGAKELVSHVRAISKLSAPLSMATTTLLWAIR